MTDEEMKQYVDDHWISVTFCRECRHLKWEGHADLYPISVCDSLKVSVTPNFWCADGEKK